MPPALLRNPELLPEFKDILDHNARVLDPSSGASDTITVDGEEIKLQPWALKARSKFAAFWRFQGSGDIALHSPEYQQYVYEMSLHQLHDRLAQRFADDPEEFMKQYPTEIPAGAVSRLTPDAMRALVASTPTIQGSQFRADHPTKPGSWVQVPPGPQQGPREFPLKPLDYNLIDTILDLGPAARAFDVPIGDPDVVEKNVEIWLKQNNATGSLMPPQGVMFHQGGILMSGLYRKWFLRIQRSTRTGWHWPCMETSTARQVQRRSSGSSASFLVQRI